MSADNGVYILKTKDQYRVAHLQAIDNISYSYIDGYQQNGKYVPSRVIEMWGNSKFTRSADKALSIAHKWSSNLSVCEYGVRVITYNKTWAEISIDAKKYAKKELDYIIKQTQHQICDMERLEKIAGYERGFINKARIS